MVVRSTIYWPIMVMQAWVSSVIDNDEIRMIPKHCKYKSLPLPLENLPTMHPAPEIQKRRTFAIIAHPDAGKTTLTEKLLLFGGAIKTAGAVKSNKIDTQTKSDWMEIEKQRGISVATSV